MSDHVLDLLKKHDISFTTSAKDYVVKCLNPEHNDNNPSFRIDKITGVAHCFSCGYKTNIFKHFGIVANFTSIKVAKLKQKLKDLHVNFNGVDFPGEVIPITKPYRGISSRTLKHFGAFYTTGREGTSHRHGGRNR